MHPAIKTSPGTLAAQVMRAQSAVHVGTKIDREQSSAGAGPVAAGGGAAVLASAVACDAVRVGTYTTRIFVHCVYIVSARCRVMVVI